MSQIDAFERRFSASALKGITAQTWDLLIRTINARLKAVEEKKADFEEAERTLLDLGLSRINETIQPAAERIYRLAELGFLVASSDTEATMVEGQDVLLTIREGDQRDLFVPTPFLAVVRRSTFEDYAIARRVSYDQATGQLLVHVESVRGNPGPHNDWDIAALAGSVMAMHDALEETQTLRDAVAADRLVVAADKQAAANERAAAENARAGAETARLGAEDALASFLRVYRGALAQPPEDGELGHFYFDTTLQQARVYTALGWAPLFTVTLGGIRQGSEVVATDGKTQFQVGGGFTLINVFKNGALLQPGVDYTATSPYFTLTVGTSAGDVISYLAYYATEETDFYPKEIADGRFLRVDGPQTLTSSQKGQALANVDAHTLGSFRNKLINGNFDIWQRGIQFNGPGAWSYTADRWRIAYDGSPTGLVVSRQNFPLGQTDVPGEPKHFLRWQKGASTGGTFMVLSQPIEDVRTLAGQVATLTFYARASSPLEFHFGLTQNFGTGGTPSADVVIQLGPVDLTTEWSKVSVVCALPSLAGKSLGTNGNHALVLNFFGSPNDAFTIDLARVSLVPGDATAEDDPFSPRHIQQEIALCQRYFCKSYPLNVAPASITLAGSIGWFASGTDSYHSIPLRFPVEMRVTPSISVYSTATGAIGQIRNVTGNADVIGGAGDVGTGGARIGVNNVSLTDVHLRAHYVADAEL